MKIHAGLEPEGKYLLKPMSNEHEVFETLDKLHKTGEKIKKNSGHRIWYDYEKVTEEVSV